MGFRYEQQSSQPATTASGFDRKATRNPQLHIVPTVISFHDFSGSHFSHRFEEKIYLKSLILRTEY